MSKYYRYLYNEENSEELNQESNLEQPELESLENLEQPEDFGGPFEQISVQEELEEIEEELEDFEPYLVSIQFNNVARKIGPGEIFKTNGVITKRDVFKIVEEKKDEFGNSWGKISLGWVPLNKCKKI